MVTLSEMKKGMNDKIARQVVDLFQQESEILSLMPFDDCMTPGGGSTLTYAYMQKQTPSTADFRAWGSEYTPGEAIINRRYADLKIFGGKFQVDRIMKDAEGRYETIAFQMKEKVRAATSLFQYAMINGTTETGSLSFEGLDSMLTDTETEYGLDTVIDLSTITALRENADVFYEALQRLIRDTEADVLMMNSDMLGKVQTVARVLGYRTETETAFGRRVTSMDGVRLIDMGVHYLVSGSSVTAVTVVPGGLTRTIDGKTYTGLTDIYAAKLDVNDGFHAVTLRGGAGVSQYLPDFSTPGAVKEGEVEMVAATVLKNTRHAGVLRNIKV